MRRGFVFFFAILSSLGFSLPSNAKGKVQKIFSAETACFLLISTAQSKPVLDHNENLCREAISVKNKILLPWVLMATEKGLVQDPKTLFKWDGVKHSKPEWNKDQFVTSWIENRVDWVTERILTQLGKKEVDRFFLELGFPVNPTAENLLLFSKAVFSEKMPLKPRALALSRELFYIGKFRYGTEVWGEKASSSDWALFLGQIESQGKRYHLATLLKSGGKSREPISAERAQALSMDALTELGLF